MNSYRGVCGGGESILGYCQLGEDRFNSNFEFETMGGHKGRGERRIPLVRGGRGGG